MLPLFREHYYAFGLIVESGCNDEMQNLADICGLRCVRVDSKFG